MALLEGGSCSPSGCPAPLALASRSLTAVVILPMAVIRTPRSSGEGPGHSRSQGSTKGPGRSWEEAGPP